MTDCRKCSHPVPAAQDSHEPPPVPHHTHEALMRLAAISPLLRGGSGRSIGPELRRQALAAVAEAGTSGVSQQAACAALGINSRSLRRWRGLERQGQNFDHRTRAPSSRPNAGLGALIRAQRRAVLQDKRFSGRSPREIVLTLMDEGRYVGSVATIYRERHKMRAEAAEQARLAASAAPVAGPCARYVYATAPNMLWSMDFTLLRLCNGSFCRMCTLMDVYDRVALAWEVGACLADRDADIASAASLAGGVFSHALETQLGDQLASALLLLRTDCSPAWRHPEFIAALQGTRVAHTCSRLLNPRDNAHSERLWRTILYWYGYPERGCSSVQAARQWGTRALRCYNEEHHHSALMGLTPLQYRRGEQSVILTRRNEVRTAVLTGTPLERYAHGGSNRKDCQPLPARLRICAETEESFSRRARERQHYLAERAASRRRRQSG